MCSIFGKNLEILRFNKKEINITQQRVKMKQLFSKKYFVKLVNSLVKTLLSRNFCQKCEKRVNFHKFQSVNHLTWLDSMYCM